MPPQAPREAGRVRGTAEGAAPCLTSGLGTQPGVSEFGAVFPWHAQPSLPIQGNSDGLEGGESQVRGAAVHMSVFHHDFSAQALNHQRWPSSPAS